MSCVVLHCQLGLNHMVDNSSFELHSTIPCATKATWVKKFVPSEEGNDIQFLCSYAISKEGEIIKMCFGVL